MSGVTGDNPIPSRESYKKILAEVKKVIKKFPGFISVNPSGSYNSDANKMTFGDMDLITTIDGSMYDNDKKKIKTELAKFLTKLPDSVITKFTSDKYAGRRYYNSGEIITVSFGVNGESTAQVDFMIAMDTTEAKFKQDFLDMPAAKQGIVLGLVKTVLIEEDPATVLKRLRIKMPELSDVQELEFNLSSKEIQLRKVTYDKPGSFKQVKREIIWESRDWTKLTKILSKFDLSLSFDDLINQAKKILKNPRSKNRMAGVFRSMVSIKSGEVGKQKGIQKQIALDKVQAIFGESFDAMSFKDFLNEGSDSVSFSFGRLNPATIGHEKLLNALKKSNPSNYRMYVSKSQDAKKNPLDFNTKIKFIKDLFPKHAKAIQTDSDVRMVFDILMKFQKEGIKHVTMVVGSDRVKEFEDMINKYNGVEARHGLYDFETLKVVSAGERDPDADDVSGMSASKMREAVKNDDFETFKSGLPKNYKKSKEYFDAVKKGMNLK